MDELSRWLDNDSLDKMDWEEDCWDCDNFSIESFCRIHRLIGNIAYGECFGHTKTGYHAFNIAYIGEDTFVIIEPQNDNIKDHDISDYKPTMIKM